MRLAIMKVTKVVGWDSSKGEVRVELEHLSGARTPDSQPINLLVKQAATALDHGIEDFDEGDVVSLDMTKV